MKELATLRLERACGLETQIQEFVRQQIRSGSLQPGTRLPPTEELAALWGASGRTVQKAVTPLVKEGLLVRRPKSGTFVRKPEEKLRCVGVYDVAGVFRESLFTRAVQAALTEELTAAGIEMDVWLDPRPHAAQGQPWAPLVEAAERRQIQALIATSTDLAHYRWQRRLPVPTAFVTSGNLPGAVGSSFLQFAELSLETLARQGCRSVGIIVTVGTTETANPDGSRHVHLEFYERLLDRIRELGLTMKNEWMRVPTPRLPWVGGEERFGHEQFLELWAQPERPQGLVVLPDTAARGVIHGLLEKQVRVPAELKLVLYKNEALDLYCPLPATFAVASERQIARALLQQIQKQFRGEPCDRYSSCRFAWKRTAAAAKSEQATNTKQQRSQS